MTIDLARLFSLQNPEGSGKPAISPIYDASSLQFLEGIHRRKSESLKLLIAAQGWPSEENVGEHGEAAAFMIALHADYDPELQHLCHAMLMGSVAQGKTKNFGFLAFLTDRILCNEGKFQRFGTQIREVTNGCFVPKPIENPDTVDELREAGNVRETLSEYLNRVNGGDLLLTRRVLNGYAEELEYIKEHKVVEFPNKPH